MKLSTALYYSLFLFLSINTHTSFPNLEDKYDPWADPTFAPFLALLQQPDNRGSLVAEPPVFAVPQQPNYGGPQAAEVAAPADTTHAQAAAAAVVDPVERDTPSPPSTRAPRQKDKAPKGQKTSRGSRREKEEYLCGHPNCLKPTHNWGTPYKQERHRQQHTGEKPFKCTLCGFLVNQKSSGITHLQSKSHRSKTEEALRQALNLGEQADVSRHLLNRKVLAQFILKEKGGK